jgi:hypothetical protein
MTRWINRFGMGSLGALVPWWFTAFFAGVVIPIPAEQEIIEGI